MAHGRKRGRPGLLTEEQWRWCITRILELSSKTETERAAERMRKRDARDAVDRAKLKTNWAMPNKQDDDFRLSDRPRVLAFVERLEEAASANDEDAYEKS